MFPTLLDACGIAIPEDLVIDGKSLLPILTGSDSDWPDRNLFYQLHAGPIPFRYVHFAVRSQRYKLVSGQDDPHRIYDQPSEFTIRQILNSLELYDIQEDPSEINNLAASFPEIVDRMLADYDSWFDEVTRERDFHFQERTELGSRFQNKVILSRFDNRGWHLGGGGSNWDSIISRQGGHWDVVTRKEETYRIRVSYEPRSHPGMLHLQYSDIHLKKPFEPGTEETVFEAVRLPVYEGKLKVYIKSGRYSEDVAYVEIETVN